MARGSGGRGKQYYNFFGSWFGLILTISMFVISFSYLGYLFFEMENYVNDVYKSQSRTNEFLEGENDFNISDYNFMPSMEIIILDHVNGMNTLEASNIDVF